LRELGILNVDKKPNSKLRYTQEFTGLEDDNSLKDFESISTKSIPCYRTNDSNVARAAMRDNDQSNPVHQIPSNDTNITVTTPPHLVSPNTNGYSNNDCSMPYNVNGENDADLSHCRCL